MALDELKRLLEMFDTSPKMDAVVAALLPGNNAPAVNVRRLAAAVAVARQQWAQPGTEAVKRERERNKDNNRS